MLLMLSDIVRDGSVKRRKREENGGTRKKDEKGEPFAKPSKISDFILLNGYFQEFCKRFRRKKKAEGSK